MNSDFEGLSLIERIIMARSTESMSNESLKNYVRDSLAGLNKFKHHHSEFSSFQETTGRLA